jgi:CRP-like cAMP-binding protein
MVTYRKGTFVMKQGDEISDDSMFYFHDGEVNIVVDGVKLISRIDGYFGEKGLLEDQPRSASIVAATDNICLQMTRKAFQNLLDCDNSSPIRRAFGFRMESIVKEDLKGQEIGKQLQIKKEKKDEEAVLKLEALNKIAGLSALEQALLDRMS